MVVIMRPIGYIIGEIIIITINSHESDFLSRSTR